MQQHSKVVRQTYRRSTRSRACQRDNDSMYEKCAMDRKADKMRKYEDEKYEHRKYREIYQNGMFIIAAAVVTLVMYHFCRVYDSDALTWILTPTARWVSVLSDIPFVYLPHQGYVNHDYRFLIAPSCAGCRFMLIMFLVMVFIDGMPDDREEKRRQSSNIRKRWLWFGCSLGLAYVFTIFVNGIRIIVSIYLPIVLEEKQLMEGWLTPNRLHTLIGTVTYFISLCVLYLLALSIHSYFFNREKRDRKAGKGVARGAAARMATYRSLSVPIFWYLLVVLALPFVKRAYHHDLAGFGQYAAVICGVCGSVCGAGIIVKWVRTRILCGRGRVCSNIRRSSIFKRQNGI